MQICSNKLQFTHCVSLFPEYFLTILSKVEKVDDNHRYQGEHEQGVSWLHRVSLPNSHDPNKKIKQAGKPQTME